MPTALVSVLVETDEDLDDEQLIKDSMRDLVSALIKTGKKNVAYSPYEFDDLVSTSISSVEVK